MKHEARLRTIAAMSDWSPSWRDDAGSRYQELVVKLVEAWQKRPPKSEKHFDWKVYEEERDSKLDGLFSAAVVQLSQLLKWR